MQKVDTLSSSPAYPLLQELLDVITASFQPPEKYFFVTLTKPNNIGLKIKRV